MPQSLTSLGIKRQRTVRTESERQDYVMLLYRIWPMLFENVCCCYVLSETHPIIGHGSNAGPLVAAEYSLIDPCEAGA